MSRVEFGERSLLVGAESGGRGGVGPQRRGRQVAGRVRGCGRGGRIGQRVLEPRLGVGVRGGDVGGGAGKRLGEGGERCGVFRRDLVEVVALSSKRVGRFVDREAECVDVVERSSDARQVVGVDLRAAVGGDVRPNAQPVESGDEALACGGERRECVRVRYAVELGQHGRHRIGVVAGVGDRFRETVSGCGERVLAIDQGRLVLREAGQRVGGGGRGSGQHDPEDRRGRDGEHGECRDHDGRPVPGATGRTSRARRRGSRSCRARGGVRPGRHPVAQQNRVGRDGGRIDRGIADAGAGVGVGEHRGERVPRRRLGDTVLDRRADEQPETLGLSVSPESPGLRVRRRGGRLAEHGGQRCGSRAGRPGAGTTSAAAPDEGGETTGLRARRGARGHLPAPAVVEEIGDRRHLAPPVRAIPEVAMLSTPEPYPFSLRLADAPRAQEGVGSAARRVEDGSG